ncbi:MAG: glycoside hydrolase family 30 beta sandwich domain-containing protein, partial [Candidatus Sumerlaeota bacterium]
IACMIMIVFVFGGLNMAAAQLDIKVDAEKEHQTIIGYGTCLVAWVKDMRALYKTEEFQDIYANGVEMNMMRVNLWGRVMKEPVQKPEDIKWQDFDLDNEPRATIFLEFGKELMKRNPDAKIIGTVWSPPPWMKMHKDMVGDGMGSIRANSDYKGKKGQVKNRVDPKYFQHFCNWMLEMVKMHDEKGAPLYAVSPGNEIQFNQSFESCVWSGEDFAKIVAMLGETLEEAGYGHVKIFGPETMTSHFYKGGTPSYIDAVKANPKALEELDVWATHGYEDGVKAEMKASSSRNFWNYVKDTGKPYWMTEGGTGDHDWPEPLHKGVANAMHNSFVAGNASAFVPWQITGGKASTHCLMVMNEYTPKTYAVMHYTKFIEPGSVRIDTEPALGTVKASAYLHKEKNIFTAVLLNPTDEEQSVTLNINGVDLKQLNTFVTDANARLKASDPAMVNDGKVMVKMGPQSMITLTTAEK